MNSIVYVGMDVHKEQFLCLKQEELKIMNENKKKRRGFQSSSSLSL